MLTRTVTINDVEYRLRACSAAAVFYEQAKGEKFDAVESLTDNLLYFWCMLAACNRDKAVMDFFDFVDALDENPEILSVFGELLEDARKRSMAVMLGKAQEDKKKDLGQVSSSPS